MKRWRQLAAPLLALAAVLPLSAQIEIDQLEESDLYGDDIYATESTNIADPFEPFNRAIFKFNDGVYRKVFKPVARTYSKIMPDPAERGIKNFFSNLKYPSRLAGNLLQGKFRGAARETGRFVVNTTAGLGGFFNPAGKIKALEESPEDIGQALGAWGVGHGFYVVLPLLGPSSVRDFAGNMLDEIAETSPDPFSRLYTEETELALRATEVANNLPGLINLYESIVRNAIDPYAALRDGYAQRRASLVEE